MGDFCHKHFPQDVVKIAYINSTGCSRPNCVRSGYRSIARLVLIFLRMEVRYTTA